MQIPNLQRAGGGEQHSPASSQTTGTHQQERYRCRRSLSESLLMVTHRKALGPGTAGHGGQQCQPGRTGAAGSAPWECRKMCPDYGCVSRGGKKHLATHLQNSHPTARQQRSVSKLF